MLMMSFTLDVTSVIMSAPGPESGFAMSLKVRLSQLLAPGQQLYTGHSRSLK